MCGLVEKKQLIYKIVESDVVVVVGEVSVDGGGGVCFVSSSSPVCVWHTGVARGTLTCFMKVSTLSYIL